MKENNTFSTVLSVILGLYILISQIMTFVFFIDYCRTDSIVKIIFIDTLLSEIKGLLWIFFIW